MRQMFVLTMISCLLVACRVLIPVKPTPIPTPTPGEVAETVLEKVADIVCPDIHGGPYPIREFFSHDTAYGFRCDPSPGHSTTTVMEWFSDESAAQAAFEDRREGRPVEEFHSFSLVVWEEDYPSFPGDWPEYRIWLWQAQHWLIEVRAFDDTHYTIAPDPEKVSEAIYQVGIEEGLFTLSQ